MKINKVLSVDDIQLSFKRIRDLKEGFITNFFLNPFIASIWIKHQLLSKVSVNKTDFFLRSDHDFKHLYYCSVSDDTLSSDLCEFMENNKCDLLVTDIVGSKHATKAISELFLSNGFNSYTSLVRMSRKPPESMMSNYIIDNEIQEARTADLLPVNKLLYNVFDRFSDQLPHIDELVSLKDRGNILLFKSDNSIKGLFIFEDIGYTCQYRYWFVDPDFREQGIGSKLMNSVFKGPKKFNRQISWVPRENLSSIKRHLHYGFLPEDLIDLILINRKTGYGTGNN